MAIFKFLAVATLAGVAAAQRGIMNITFYNSDSSNSDTCDQHDDDITFSVDSVPALLTCFNLNTTFLHTNVSYSDAGYSCASSPCGTNYTLYNAGNFNPNANYSRISYSQHQIGNDKKGYLMFQTYSGPNCLQLDKPWLRWNCNSDPTCDNVHYDIMSFAVVPTASDDYVNDDDDNENDDEGCVLAAVNGNAASSTAVSRGMVVLVLAAIGFSLLG